MAGLLNHLRQSGWLHAIFIAVLPYPLGTLAARVGMVNFHAHPIAYTAMAMLATSISLMLFAKPGPLGNETLKRPETWLYGALSALVGLMSVWMTVYVSATEATLLQRSSTVWIFIISVFYLGHRLAKGEWLGLGVISAAIILLLTQVSLGTTALIQLCVLLVVLGIIQSIQKIVVETHKTNRAAVTFQQNMRVTAVVMGVTSGMFLLLFLGLAYIKSLSPEPIWPSLPTLQDFINWPMFVLTACMGLLLHAPAKYCEFFAAKKISAKYMMAVLTLQPLFTALYESALNGLGWLHMTPLQSLQYLSLALVIAGSLWLAVAGYRKDAKGGMQKPSFILDPAVNAVVRQMVALTLTFTKGSKSRAAALLEVEADALREVLQDKKNDLQFTKEFVRRVQKNFAEHVAMADPLTGLSNRLQFMTALTEKLKGKNPVHVVLLDLNGFKPVNDTYGHAAGDAVLQGVAKRLQKNLPKGAVIARFGGDEFALFSTASVNIAKLQTTLAAPYKTRFGSLKVTASLGQATSPKDGKTPAALLEAADKRMYSFKKGR